MRADRVRPKAMLPENLPPFLAIVLVRQRRLHVKMVPPTGQLHPVISKLPGLFADLLKLQIGPLACEQSYGSRHASISFANDIVIRQCPSRLVKSNRRET